MLDYAVKLTRAPWSVSEKDLRRLHQVGFEDREILDIVQVASYYNFVNRLADGLGLSTEDIEQTPTP